MKPWYYSTKTVHECFGESYMGNPK